MREKLCLVKFLFHFYNQDIGTCVPGKIRGFISGTIAIDLKEGGMQCCDVHLSYLKDFFLSYALT